MRHISQLLFLTGIRPKKQITDFPYTQAIFQFKSFHFLVLFLCATKYTQKKTCSAAAMQTLEPLTNHFFFNAPRGLREAERGI